MEKVATPALLVFSDRLDANLKAIHKDLPPGIKVRPHAKAHKSSVIGLMQIRAGATGLCAAKLREAEALVAGGCLDVCITNQIVGSGKIERLASLASVPGARISVCVDDSTNIKEIAKAMKKAEVKGLEVLVEINVGQNRCGVSPGKEAADLAQMVEDEGPWLKFKGLHAYHGSNQHVPNPTDRKATVENKVAGGVKETLSALKTKGIDCEVVTGGGTGSYTFEVGTGVYNEIQPGSYIFMDVAYSKVLDNTSEGKFVSSLFVLGTVISLNKKGGWAVVDAGMKSLSLDSGPPRIFSLDLHPRDQLEYVCGGDEHGIIKGKGATNYKVGDLVLLQPGHCDPTVNLYDEMTFMRKGKDGYEVEKLVEVTARGPGV